MLSCAGGSPYHVHISFSRLCWVLIFGKHSEACTRSASYPSNIEGQQNQQRQLCRTDRASFPIRRERTNGFTLSLLRERMAMSISGISAPRLRRHISFTSECSRRQRLRSALFRCVWMTRSHFCAVETPRCRPSVYYESSMVQGEVGEGNESRGLGCALMHVRESVTQTVTDEMVTLLNFVFYCRGL